MSPRKRVVGVDAGAATGVVAAVMREPLVCCSSRRAGGHRRPRPHNCTSGATRTPRHDGGPAAPAGPGTARLPARGVCPPRAGSRGAAGGWSAGDRVDELLVLLEPLVDSGVVVLAVHLVEHDVLERVELLVVQL